MDNSEEQTGEMIFRAPPSDYASAKYALGILSVAAIVVGVAVSGALNNKAPSGDQAAAPAATAGAPPTASADAKQAESPAAAAKDTKHAEALPASPEAKQAEAPPAPASTGASNGEAGQATPPAAPESQAAPSQPPAAQEQPSPPAASPPQ